MYKRQVLATTTALHLADYTITEAGFGADLGAEKFLDIKTPNLPTSPDAVVIVATLRALKMNGGVTKDALTEENVEAVRAGFANLKRHVENIRKFGIPAVVAINEFITDTEAEIAALKELCEMCIRDSFRGDGITVSTPTGSTAYNKSLGGAVLHPTIEALQIAEIASLNNRVYRTCLLYTSVFRNCQMDRRKA